MKRAGAAGNSRTRRGWVPGALLIVVLVLVAYGPALRSAYIWDDPEYVTQNPALRSAQGLERIWFEPGATPQYYPLVFTFFWTEYHLWGLDPFGYHLVNVLLHALGALLIWSLLARLSVPGAWAAAALFALHPVHVESVAWITERKNVLSLVLYLSSFLAYLRFAVPRGGAAPARRFYFLAMILFLCALLSKTVACTLPAAILLVLIWKKGRLVLRDVLPLVPFFAAGATMGLMTVWMEKFHVGALGDEWSLTLPERCLLAGRIPWFYAGKLVWPVGLVFIYPRWVIDTSAWWQYLFPLAGAVVIAVLWLKRRRWGAGPLVAVLFFGGTLVPALGFFNVYPMRFSFVADHFQYLASAGLIALGTALSAAAASRLGSWGRPSVVALCSAVLAFFGTITWHQCHTYKDQETLWRDTLDKNHAAWIAHNNLGEILVAQGRFDEAMLHLNEALELKPGLSEAQGNLANALFRKGRIDEAVSLYQEMLRTEPENAKAQSNLGAILESRGELAEAAARYGEALRINPGYANAHFNLANVLVKQEKLADAAGHYAEAVRLAPGFAKAHYRLGKVLQGLGRNGEAGESFRTALRLARAAGDMALVREIERGGHNTR